MEARRARSFELVSAATVDRILTVDCRARSYPPKFVSANALTAYIGINSWLIFIQDVAGDVWYDVLLTLCKFGLIATVQRFADAADAIVHGEEVADPLVHEVLYSVGESVLSHVTSLGYRPGRMAIQLSVCRYLKRMNLEYRADARAAAISGFESTQKELRSTVIPVSHELCRDDMAQSRDILRRALPWPDIITAIKSMKPWDRTFTSGAASDAGQKFGQKLKQMSVVNPDFFHPIMGAWIDCHPSKAEDYGFTTDYNDYVSLGFEEYSPRSNHAHVVKLSTAPKNMKGPRIIAMEPTDLQAAQRYVKDILYRYMPEGMDLNDQEPNRELAAEGARTGKFATLDLSSASDYVTKDLVWGLFPPEFLDAIWWMVPSHYRVGNQGEPQQLFSFATMGNGLTFWMESVTFWAILRPWCLHGAPTVYGDDIVVRTEDARRCMDVLKAFGFKINETKSFVEGPYRESCGFEACGNDRTDSIYYPRFPVKGSVTDHTVELSNFSKYDDGEWVDATTRLVELQHRMTNWSDNGARFIAAVLRDAHPAMTTSRWGSVSPDVWGPESIRGPVRAAPAAIIRRVQPDPEAGPDQEVEVSSPAFEDLGLDNLPDAAFRETWYAPRCVDQDDSDEEAKALLRHYCYAQFLRHGPQWQEGDGWLPDTAWLTHSEADRTNAKTLVWGMKVINT